jgi:hypothetical protein
MKTKAKPEPDETGEMVKIGTTMDGPTLDALKAFCKVSGMPMAEAIRRAVRSFLSQQEQSHKPRRRVS